jgi:hypothetical protein
MKWLTTLVAAIALGALGDSVLAQYQVISTYPNWSGTSAFAQMGEQPSSPSLNKSRSGSKPGAALW